MYTVTTKTDRFLREDHNTKAKVAETLDATLHTLTGDNVWTATVANPALNQKVGDQWLEVTAVDGTPVTSRYLAIKDNGTVYSTTTPPYTPPVTTSKPRTHTVVGKDTLYSLANTYGTTVDKIVAANKQKYSKPGHEITASHIEIGWELIV